MFTFRKLFIDSEQVGFTQIFLCLWTLEEDRPFEESRNFNRRNGNHLNSIKAVWNVGS